MTELARIEFSALMLDLDPHKKIVSLIGRRLMLAGIDKTAMVYCGIDGSELAEARDTEDLGSDEATFGCTWEQLRSTAEEQDKYGTVEASPIKFANLAPKLPTVMVYDLSELVEEPSGFSLWVPRISQTVSDAARAIIFFA